MRGGLPCLVSSDGAGNSFENGKRTGIAAQDGTENGLVLLVTLPCEREGNEKAYRMAAYPALHCLTGRKTDWKTGRKAELQHRTERETDWHGGLHCLAPLDRAGNGTALLLAPCSRCFAWLPAPHGRKWGGTKQKKLRRFPAEFLISSESLLHLRLWAGYGSISLLIFAGKGCGMDSGFLHNAFRIEIRMNSY